MKLEEQGSGAYAAQKRIHCIRSQDFDSGGGSDRIPGIAETGGGAGCCRCRYWC